jgi:hypothetical protein
MGTALERFILRIVTRSPGFIDHLGFHLNDNPRTRVYNPDVEEDVVGVDRPLVPADDEEGVACHETGLLVDGGMGDPPAELA